MLVLSDDGATDSRGELHCALSIYADNYENCDASDSTPLSPKVGVCAFANRAFSMPGLYAHAGGFSSHAERVMNE